jgi:hypothetical protein
MATEPRDIRAIANAYGFGLQLAVEHAVAESKTEWNVNTREHGWRDGDEPKFIDLVITNANGGMHLVVECKRTQGGSWVFLLPTSGDCRPRLNARAVMTRDHTVGDERRAYAQVSDLYSQPETFESSFCGIRGAGERDRPMLDRICAELVRGADAVAGQQLLVEAPLRDSGPSQPELRNVVMPVIVTTATLYVCRFDPGAVSLETGMIPDDASIDPVEAIRYEKSFDTAHPPTLRVGDTLRTLEEHARRTVMIVTASAFPGWLRKVTIWASGWR